MKITELEDAEKIVTKEYLDMKLSDLKAELFKVLLDQQKSMLEFQGRLYAMVIGTYALIIIGMFVNHFWR